ncbi:hypothetical protein J1779_08000 [Rahnella sp. FC061912-K]|uniref:hypothetical protein n=1 Tax=Rahnella rivi TaxID=2816249 RepID=UPI001C267B9A|nr:hypothetical protein [Rahnella rivi]MBU9829873.1 hypothetical protein [Rahnella rivi]
MYALKIVDGNFTEVNSIGCKFKIQRYDQTAMTCSGSAIAIVTGEDERFAWEIPPSADAFITTLEGKTVEVIHRSLHPRP